MANRFSKETDKKIGSKRPGTATVDRFQEINEHDHFRSLVDNVALALWKAPYDSFRFSYVSPEAEKIFGYPQDECLAPGFLEKIIPEEEREWVKEYSKLAVQQNHTYQMEYHIITKKGKVKTLRDIVRLIYKDGKPFQKIGATMDISIYSQTLGELQASNRKFFSAFYHFPVPATIFRIKDGRCMDVNKNFLQSSGYERKDIIGKSPMEMNDWINYAERNLIIKSLKRNMRLDKYPLLVKDALLRLRNVLVSAERFDNDGEPCMLVMFHDVTEQINAEQRLQQTNRELETFMYKSSHNLKGPVASIKGLVYLANKNANDPQTKQYLELMEQSALGLEITLKELMDIARIKQGKIQAEVVDLNSMLDQIKDKLKFMPEWREVSYAVSVQQTFPFYTDLSLLHSILQNLIENAVKYKDEKREALININATVRRNEIVIDVIDNGLGIPLEYHERVFEMFFRGHNAANGTGLGLYIVKNSVEKLGGRIDLQSKLGMGSTFTITLPNFHSSNKN